jgi:predicted enzyme related to lactoylglutathione lyase
MPVIEVSDVVKSAAFYEEKLGLSAGRFFGDPPQFCIVGRDTVTIALDQSHAPDRKPHNQYWAAYVYVDDVDGLAAELKGREVEILRGPEDMPHGCREIDVTDPDGHIVCFGQDLSPTEAGPGL